MDFSRRLPDVSSIAGKGAPPLSKEPYLLQGRESTLIGLPTMSQYAKVYCAGSHAERLRYCNRNKSLSGAAQCCNPDWLSSPILGCCVEYPNLPNMVAQSRQNFAMRKLFELFVLLIRHLNIRASTYPLSNP